MKKILFTFLVLACTSVCHAQKIDFNMSGRPDAEGTAPGYLPWAPGRTTKARKAFPVPNSEKDSVKITISSVEGIPGNNAIHGHYNKGLVYNNIYKLLGDAVDAIYMTNPGGSNDYDDPKTEQCGIQLKISGLRAGQHSLMAYHSFIADKLAKVPTLNVYVNDSLAEEGVQQSLKALVESECASSYVTFSVTGPEQEVVIKYISQLKADESYSNSGVSINAIVFDETKPSFVALDPSPKDDDTHVDADDGTCLLQWTGAAAAVKHHIYFGTESGKLTKVATTTEPNYSVSDLYSMNNYYWRVDEEMSDGKVYAGTEWSFKPRQLAFPDAEGYGRFATGGRGGDVYHVTSLADDGTPGTFRYGLTSAKGPRTIVFDVSGIIFLKSRILSTGNYMTIAGQTAPGHGICFRNNPIGLSSDNIVRFMRLRKGAGETSDGMGIAGGNNTILDHTSISWTIDEAFSSRSAQDITLQRTMLAEALGIAGHKNYAEGTNHGYAASIGGDIGSFHHNLLVDCNGRNWSLAGALDGAGYYAGRLDIFNNVCYNWYKRATDGGAMEVNFVGNYYKMGIDTKQTYILRAQFEGVGKGIQRYYLKDNIRENYSGSLTPDTYGDTYCYELSNGQVLDWDPWVKEPFFPSYAKVENAKDAFKSVCSDVGATMPFFDAHDQRMIYETVNKKWTYKGSKSGIRGEIDNEADCGGYEVYPEETRGVDFDTDNDGIPNWYEKLVGSDENVANNNDDPDKDGWTMLEDYLEFMAHPYVIIDANSSETVNLAPYFRGYTKAPVYSIDGSSFLTTSITDSLLTIKTSNAGGIIPLKMTVTDAEGSTYSQRISVAVTGDITAINQIFDESKLDIVSKDFYTLDGKKVRNLRSHETYIMKITDSKGNIHTTKIIKD